MNTINLMMYKADCIFEAIPLDIPDNNHPKMIQVNQKTNNLKLSNLLIGAIPNLNKPVTMINNKTGSTI